MFVFQGQFIQRYGKLLNKAVEDGQNLQSPFFFS